MAPKRRVGRSRGNRNEVHNPTSSVSPVSASSTSPTTRATAGRRQSSNPQRHKRRKKDRALPYAYLESHTRHIAERTIKSKWTTLPEPAQEKVKELFRSLERPVIVRQKDEKRRMEAQIAVAAVVKNLSRRLPRMPFPPMNASTTVTGGRRVVAFDYEGVLNENRALEAQLSNTTNTIDLLKVEVEREEALLVQERRQHEELEKNAKQAESERKRQMKNEHPIIRKLDNLRQSQDASSTMFSVIERPDEDIALCEHEPDSELQSLLIQLNGHLQSMQNNVGPFAVLRDAIIGAEAALDFAVPVDR